MAKKIELLHTTYDESGNIESQEVVHPLTSPDCIIMENGKTLDEVMGDGIATPTLTHEGTSFKVGVGDSNIEVVDGDVAGMTLKGQSYQNILPKPTTLIMETDEKEFKINDKIDSNIIIDDNIAEIATVKGKTIVNAIQEESDSEYTVLGEDLSGQSIAYVKETPTLEGNTLINIQPKTTFIAGANPIHMAWANNNVTQRPQPNKKYFIKLYNLPKCVNQVYLAETIQYLNDKDYAIITPLIDDSVSYNKLHIYADTLIGYIQPSELNTIQALVCEYIDGMENWDIPYFEGTKTFESNIKGVTLQGQTLVNTIQEPCKDDYVVLGADDGIEISAETGGHGTIEDTVQGGINGAVLEGQTLVNIFKSFANYTYSASETGVKWLIGGSAPLTETLNNDELTMTITGVGSKVVRIDDVSMIKPNTKYMVKINYTTSFESGINFGYVNNSTIYTQIASMKSNEYAIFTTPSDLSTWVGLWFGILSDLQVGDVMKISKPVLIEYQEGMENWDIPYFEGMKSVQMPVLTTTGKNTLNYRICGTRMGAKIKNITDNSITFSVPQAWAGLSWFYYLEPNQKYTASFKTDLTVQQVKGYVRFPNTNLNAQGGSHYFSFTTDSTGKIQFTIESVTGAEEDIVVSDIQIEKGSTGTSYEPYQSSTISINDYVLNSTQFEQGTFSESSPAGTPYRQTLPTGYMDIRLRSKSLFKVSGNAIRGTLNEGYGIFFGFFKDGKYLAKHSTWMDSTSFSVDVPYECNEFCIVLRKNISDTINVSEYDLIGLTLEQVVELRGIGDVKDELDLQTGKLTQRIYEIVFDGSDDEDWILNNTVNTTTNRFIITIPKSKVTNDEKGKQSYLCDKLQKGLWSDTKTIGITIIDDAVFLYNKNIDYSINALRNWLQSNPITVQYPLATESVKTIDLQVTDQDGNTIPHIQTQPTVTHITASSDYLIPTVTIDNNLSYDTIIKPSTLYTVRFKRGNVNADNPLIVDLGGTAQVVTSTEFTITTPSELTHNQLVFSGKNNVVSEVRVIEGNVINIEYPFFEGMNDVKFSDSKFIATGKNLLHIPSNVELIGGYRYDVDISHSNGVITLSGKNPSITTTEVYVHTNICAYLVAGRTYTVSFKSDATPSKINGTDTVEMFLAWDNKYDSNNPYGKYNYTNIYNNTQTFTPVLTGMYYLRLDLNLGSATHTFYDIQIEEGSVATEYEPYKGVEVQQDVDSIPLTSDMFEQGTRERGIGMSLQQCPLTQNSARISSKTLIPVKSGSKYTVSGINTSVNHIWGDMYDKDGLVCYDSVLDLTGGISSGTGVFVPHDVHYLCIKIKNADESAITPSDLDSMNLILQEVPQEIVLRGIGNVKDELDLTRGEYIQRIGKFMLDGSQTYIIPAGEEFNTIQRFRTTIPNIKNVNAICDKLPTEKTSLSDDERLFVASVGENGSIYFNLLKTKATNIDELKTYLSQNPITIQYVLTTPIIHKVNLTNTKVIPSYTTETRYETITPSDSLIPNITIPSTLNYDVAIKPSTEYTIRANTSDNLTVNLGGATGTLSNGKVTLTTPATLTHNEVKFSGTGKVKELMVVEGSEIKDNVPFFNGMKDVQMGGIKLVNIARGATCSNLVTASPNKTQFTYTGNGTNWGNIFFDKSLLKPNTLYTIYFNIVSNNSDAAEPVKISLGDDLNTWVNATGTGLIKKTFSSNNNLNNKFSIMFRPCTSGKQVVIQNPMIIEGDWTHLDEIPFIESEMIIDQPIIRSQGKNLLDPTIIQAQSYNGNTVTKVARGFNIKTSEQSKGWNENVLFYIDVEPYTEYTYSFIKNVITDPYANKIEQGGTVQWREGYCFVRGVQTNDVRMEGSSPNSVRKYMSFNSGNNTKLYIYHNAITDNGCGVGEFELLDFQLEKGRSTTTQYKAYRHQTLYSNRVIGYEEGVHYGYGDGIKYTNADYNSVMADVEGLSIAYVTNGSTNFTFWDKDGVLISGKAFLDTSLSSGNRNGFITVPTNAKYMKFASSCAVSVNTDYTKATVTGDLPLRSLPSGVCDTLNLVTGEYVQRVGEVVLDGSQKDESWLYNETNQTLRIYIEDVVQMQDSLSDPLRYEILVSSDKLTSKTYVEDWNSGTFISLALGKRIVLRIEGITTTSQLTTYLKQNPITVQYELATPIVRKLEFTTKGNYREQVLDGSEAWIWNQEGTLKTTERFSLATITDRVCGVDNLWCNTIETTNTYNFDAEGLIGSSASSTIYLRIKKDKCNSSWDGFVRWLSQNPTKISYLTNQQSSESYSNIHKPIFFNNVNVQFLPQNLDIQPELTLQARTRNSYVMDMMKPNTKYSIKLLSFSGAMLIDGIHYALENNRTFISPSTLTNKELIITSQWYEPMIIEGDVTGKNLPYFKGILSSYHDVDEIEVYSANKNLFDIKGSVNEQYDFMYDIAVQGGKNYVKDNVIYCVDDSQSNYGSGQKIKCKPNTKYCISFHSENLARVGIHLPNKANVAVNLGSTFSYTTPNDCYEFLITFYRHGGENDGTHIIRNLQIEESSTSTSYIQHAHNTTLIEMPTRLETVKVVRPKLTEGAINSSGGVINSTTHIYSDFIPVQPMEEITIKNLETVRGANVYFYDKNKTYMGNYVEYVASMKKFVISNDCYFIRFYLSKPDTSDLTITRQAYKPIQLNSLPNGVCDEIIMKPNSNKAQLVQRVGKVVLDGSENWDMTKNDGWLCTRFSYYGSFNTSSYTTDNIYSNKKYIGGYHGQHREKMYTIRLSNNAFYIFDGSINEVTTFKQYLQQDPLTVYYELSTPIIHEIQLKGYPHVYENGTVTLNTDTPHQTLVSYNVNQEQLINTQNETIIRHDQQIDDLYYYIEMYLEEIYQMELFRMKLELSL